jgi:hypothetical protein
MVVRGSTGTSPEGAVMAQYLVLIYSNEASWATTDDDFSKKIMDGHNRFGEKHGASLRGGNALEPSMSSTSIRTKDSGESVTTDGPFAETKEALGGYYLIEADDLDAAIAIAKDIPAPFGGVEVRPIRDMS